METRKFYASKDTHTKVETQPTGWQEMCLIRD